MSADENPDELTEKIKILATDDEKIKSFGELLTNDSSREILQLLFNEELTATQISQKTETSLQLVKYHLNKLQDLGVVKISKIEKNSKSQDMKFYTASKFSIVIVPPKLSEKTRESKLLVRSFRHIYKVAGLGIATGISGLLSAFQLNKPQQIAMDDSGQSAGEPSEKQLLLSEPTTAESGDLPAAPEPVAESGDLPAAPEPVAESGDLPAAPEPVAESGDLPAAPEPVAESILEAQPAAVLDDSIQTDEVENFASEETIQATLSSSSDLFLPLIIITAILGGLTIFHLVTYFKKQ